MVYIKRLEPTMKLNHENEFNDLKKFILLIPSDTINKSIDKVIFINRAARRKFDKLKSIAERVDSLIANTEHRCSLITTLNEIYNESYEINRELAYDDFVSAISNDNSIHYILYILSLCCDDDYDRNHFSDFVNSAPFQNTINNTWQIHESETSTVITNHAEETNEIFIKEEKKMKCYLGLIELRNTFYNFKPQCILLEKGGVDEITKSQLDNDFPIYGSLNLAYKMSGKSQRLLSELNVDRSSNNEYPHRGFYAISFDDNELQTNDNEKIQFKIDLQKISDEGIDLSTRIKPLSDINIFKIATPLVAGTINDIFNRTNVQVSDEFDAGDIVLLNIDDELLYGPYKVIERSIDGMKYIQPDASSHKYIVTGYSEFQNIELETLHYMQDPIYTNFAVVSASTESFDVIADEILLSKLSDKINLETLSENPQEFMRLYETSPYLSDIPVTIKQSRIEKIQTLIGNALSYEEKKRNAILSLIDNRDTDIQKIIENTEIYKDKITEINKLTEDKAALQSEKEELESKNGLLSQELANGNHASVVDNEENKKLEKEKESLVKSIEKLKKDYTSLQEIANLENEQYHLKRAKEELQKDVSELKSARSDLESKVKDAISKGYADAAGKAFDPFISNAMIEAASDWNSKFEEEKYTEIVKSFSAQHSAEHYEKAEFIDKLVSYIKEYRNYSKNDIINMYICLSQNFLTVFSGEPGTGKTSICNILANALGLNSLGECDDISINRYVAVSVERGWSSKRDLIGYYNPLTKKYDRSNAKIYDGLMILNQERDESKYPYVILLDEANLSPMEYYWADFMRVADKSESNSYINIGLSDEIYIPRTLRFLATINNDQTTERLSPRLIDRSWIVKLPQVELKENANIDCSQPVPLVSWLNIEDAFIKSDCDDVILKTPLEQIYALFVDNRLSVSPRVQLSIKRYICVAQEIMEDEPGVCNKKQKALDFAVLQKLLPKIDGYYDNYERLFKYLLQICEENSLRMTKKALQSMQEYQVQNMGYCQYLI